MAAQRSFSRSPETTDRALIVACAVVWLLALGFFVAAGVALTDLGRGQPQAPTAEGATPWLLYSVIGVSAVVIVAAVPLLLRARRGDWPQSRPARGTTGPVTPPVRAAVATPRAGSALPPAAVDRLWLRGGLGVLTLMGLALVAVAIGTHLMAVDSVTASWVAYGVAALLTVAMIAVPLYLLRDLRAALDSRA